MEIKRYSVADEFLDDNHRFLFAQEAANNLIIGMAARWSARKKKKGTPFASLHLI